MRAAAVSVQATRRNPFSRSLGIFGKTQIKEWQRQKESALEENPAGRRILHTGRVRSPFLRHGDGLEALEDPRQAVVHIDAVAMAEKLFAMFFDADIRPLLFADAEVVDLMERLIEKTLGSVNGLLVHDDLNTAPQLVEVEFHQVLFRLPDFHFEGHTI